MSGSENRTLRKDWNRDTRSLAVIISSNSTDDEIPRTQTQPNAS